MAVRSYKKELLDEEDIPFPAIQRNMQELNFINTWLGGHSITIAGLKQLLGNRKEVLVCEIGCGGGDNMVALYTWCKSNNIKAIFYGIDIKPACIHFASGRSELQTNTTWLQCDYRTAKFDRKPDIIFSSLFCHHFTNEQLIKQLQWMAQHATIGFFINDLQRHALAYHLIKQLTSVFSSSYLVKHDAPLSVARGFKKHEWCNLLQKGGLSNATVVWKWAFRYLVIYKHG